MVRKKDNSSVGFNPLLDASPRAIVNGVLDVSPRKVAKGLYTGFRKLTATPVQDNRIKDLEEEVQALNKTISSLVRELKKRK